MFVFSNLLIAIAKILDIALKLYMWIIIGRAIISWVSPDPSNPIVQTIYGISEPLLAPFRRIIPHIGGLDISPILALLCFQVIGVAGQQIIAGIIKAI